jgi:1-acyl-sn-glycerol-3-phosphate acyltransferase
VAHPLRWARTAYEYIWLCLGYAYFGGLGLLVTLVSAVLYPLLPRQVGSHLARSVIGTLFRSFLALLRAAGLLRVDLSALDALRGERGVIIAPNHPSLLDAVFVISRIPGVACIMKAKIWDNPVLGGGARLAGYIRNDSPRGMVRQAASEVQAGHSLLVFPEGTRTRSRPINRFKGGFALIAKRAGAPVQTVFIETDNPFLGKSWPAFKRPRFPLVYRVRLGERFSVTGDVQTFLGTLEDYYRRELGPAAAAPAHPTPAPASADLIAG